MGTCRGSVFFPWQRRRCEKLAVGFTAAGVLAISLSIDSLLKAIDSQPAACVHM